MFINVCLRDGTIYMFINVRLRDGIIYLFFNVCLQNGTNDLFINVCLQDGTTDVTRTLHFGNPTEYEKECFTRVLKGSFIYWIY